MELGVCLLYHEDSSSLIYRLLLLWLQILLLGSRRAERDALREQEEQVEGQRRR